MANNEFNKQKLLYIAKILFEESDEQHPMGAEAIIDRLSSFGIDAERKSIYADVAVLNEFGIKIDKSRLSKTRGYYIADDDRQFSLPELKFLLDAISSSRFVTERKSKTIVKKLLNLTSKHNAMSLNREVYVQNRIRSINEESIYIVDAIHQAILGGKVLAFSYKEWGIDKRLHDKKEYRVIPKALAYMNENYYLLAHDIDSGYTIKHFRVDKMHNPNEIEVEIDRQYLIEKIDVAKYCNYKFNMFSGDLAYVEIRAKQSMVGVLLDRFGTDITINQNKDDTFTTSVQVEVSPQFYAFIFGISEHAEIIGPASVREGYKEYLKMVLNKYK